MTRTNYENKLARFQEAEARGRNAPMSKQYHSRVVRKLLTEIEAATDPKVIADLGNVLAKFLPTRTKTRRQRDTQAPIKAAKEPTLDELVAEMEKKRKEARKSLDGEKVD